MKRKNFVIWSIVVVLLAFTTIGACDWSDFIRSIGTSLSEDQHGLLANRKQKTINIWIDSNCYRLEVGDTYSLSLVEGRYHILIEWDPAIGPPEKLWEDKDYVIDGKKYDVPFEGNTYDFVIAPGKKIKS